MLEAKGNRVGGFIAPTWYNLPCSEKIVMCLSKPALPVQKSSVSCDGSKDFNAGFSWNGLGWAWLARDMTYLTS